MYFLLEQVIIDDLRIMLSFISMGDLCLFTLSDLLGLKIVDESC